MVPSGHADMLVFRDLPRQGKPKVQPRCVRCSKQRMRNAPRYASGAKRDCGGGLFWERRRFRHGRTCSGHPRRDAQSRFKNKASLGADESIGVRNRTRPATTWMAGTSPAMTRSPSEIIVNGCRSNKFTRRPRKHRPPVQQRDESAIPRPSAAPPRTRTSRNAGLLSRLTNTAPHEPSASQTSQWPPPSGPIKK